MRTAAALLSAAVVAPLAAQEPALETRPPAEPARAEVVLSRTLFAPRQPIRAQFLIVNPNPEPIELTVPGAEGADARGGLPSAAVFGPEGLRALWISYQDEPAVAVRPADRVELDVSEGGVQLAPFGVVGTEVNLVEVHRALRYSGVYRLEWRPPGGLAPPPPVTFRVEPRKIAMLVTDYGKVTFTLNYEGAPRNVENFLELVRDRFYTGKLLHKIIPGGVIQGGCPHGNGRGIRPDGKLVVAEFSRTPFDVGTLAMALAPGNPNSASCQFFISLARLEELDGRFTIIGQARDEESLRTLHRLSEIPTDRETHRPLRPVSIRSIALLDADPRPPAPAPLQPSSEPPAAHEDASRTADPPRDAEHQQPAAEDRAARLSEPRP